MDHIKNIKVKDIKVILCYYFGSGKLKGSLDKLELVEAVTDFSRKYQEGVVQMEGGGCIL